jgi:pimeloyl-ACP methyl ester carboxylesterase
MQHDQAAGVTLQDATVEARGLRLHYRAWQPQARARERPTGARMAEPGEAQRPPPQAGISAALPPILLIHGLASAANIWDLTAPFLARRGFRVVALDQRGHGESDKPDHGYSFAEILADDHAAAEALGLERPIVVGHSWGGGVVLNYAAAYPQDVHAIVLVDGGFIQMNQRDGWTKERMLKDLAPPQFAGTPAEVFLTFPRRGPLADIWSPQLEDIFLHIVELRADGTVAPRLSLANHLQILEAMWDQPTLALYDQVSCPILLVCPEQQATDDRSRQFQRAKREGIARILAAHSSVRVEYLPDTIHDVPLQRPETLAALIAQMAGAA